jgi:hypothetical protein
MEHSSIEITPISPIIMKALKQRSSNLSLLKVQESMALKIKVLKGTGTNTAS